MSRPNERLGRFEAERRHEFSSCMRLPCEIIIVLPSDDDDGAGE
jgi:hypothetical protein